MNNTFEQQGTPPTEVRRPLSSKLTIGIILVPVIFAWFTLRRGYTGLARGFSFAWMLASFVLVAMFYSPQAVPYAPAPVADASSSNGTGAAEPAQAASPATASELDMAAYSRIKAGMSYIAVRQIVGADGEEQSSSDLGGLQTVEYTWRNSDGADLTAIFQNDKLVSKAQVGLH